MATYDIAVLGGGLVGAAIAYGLADGQRRVAMLDEGDVAYREPRGNFGLIWVQGKGMELPAYAAWTRLSARRWPELAARLRDGNRYWAGADWWRAVLLRSALSAASIAGARAAEYRGCIAALGAAYAANRIGRGVRETKAAACRGALKQTRRGRRFLDVLYQPPARLRVAEGDTIVCRCEEITAREIIAVARAGRAGPNQMKAFLRCGMGNARVASAALLWLS